MPEYTLLKDYVPHEKGLLYSSPCRGLWNIVHLATQVPGSHQIYVCPTSCLRGVVLTTAEMGCMDRLSTITVGEDNILEGDLEETILKGTRKVLHTLERKPTVVFIFTSCIHHFMAANFLRVYKQLRKEFPDIAFLDAYMDPIMRKKTPPLPSLQRQVYRVLEKQEQLENQCNFIDNWFSAEYNDIAENLKKHNVIVKDFSMQNDYTEYLDMAKSHVNFVFHPFGMLAAKDLYYRLQQDYVYLPIVYDYDAIDANTKEACSVMHIPSPTKAEIEEKRSHVEQAIERLKSTIGDTPISIDKSAIDCPISLATYLIERGFIIESIFLDGCNEDLSKLKQLAPNIQVYDVEKCEMRLHDRTTRHKVLAIGQQAAYFCNTPYFVDCIFSAQMYGYAGILHLIDVLLDAYTNPKDIRTTISHKGWRCHAHG